MRGKIEFNNIDEIARFLVNDLSYNEPMIIRKHIKRGHIEWFYHSVEAWAELPLFPDMHLFRILMSKDKKAIIKVKA